MKGGWIPGNSTVFQNTLTVLNLITLGQREGDNINRMTTINDVLLIQSTELLVILAYPFFSSLSNIHQSYSSKWVSNNNLKYFFKEINLLSSKLPTVVDFQSK
jgi:hypothetical protein